MHLAGVLTDIRRFISLAGGVAAGVAGLPRSHFYSSDVLVRLVAFLHITDVCCYYFTGGCGPRFWTFFCFSWRAP